VRRPVGFLLCALVLLGLCRFSRAAAAAGGGEGERPPPDEADWVEIEALLGRFGKAMTSGEPERIVELLSPTVAKEQRKRFAAAFRREFATVRWLRFRFIESPREYFDVLPAAGRVERHLAVNPVARYASRHLYRHLPEPSPPPPPEETVKLVQLKLERVSGRWGITECDLFPLLGHERDLPRAWAKYFWWVLGAAALVIFWFWMVIDCSIRYSRWSYSLAVLLLPGLGALVYLFVGWRRRRIPETP